MDEWCTTTYHPEGYYHRVASRERGSSIIGAETVGVRCPFYTRVLCATGWSKEHDIVTVSDSTVSHLNQGHLSIVSAQNKKTKLCQKYVLL